MKLDWKRFWVKMGTEISCGFEGNSYFDDPDIDNFISSNHSAQTIDQLKDFECLVLLGEPGLGKSTAIEQAFPRVDYDSGGSDEVIWIRFIDIPDSSAFIRDVFEDPRWRRWEDDETRLTLVLDGLDEGLLKIKDFLPFLTKQLRRYSAKRLKLVLTCRTVDWPSGSGGKLASIWDLPEPSTWELCPLRSVDVKLAAKSASISVDDFLDGLYKSNLRPLAARPITLLFLIDQYKKGQGFNGSFRDIYHKGIRNLCEEPDEERARKQKLDANLNFTDPENIYRAASKIAATFIFCAKSSIHIGSAKSSTKTDVTIESLHLNQAVNRTNSIAALNTALFSSRGTDQFGFSHHTFAEFLAAQFAKELTLNQQKSILIGSEGNREFVTPQLTETAAWLAGEDEGFLKYVLAIDPEVILKSDVSRLNSQNKKRVIDSILLKVEQQELFNEYGLTRFFQNYNHDGIQDQLRSYITDDSYRDETREMAIDIARALNTSDFEDCLLLILKDEQTPMSLRGASIEALENIISDDNLELLIPFAQANTSESSEKLKGHALSALIPRRWTVSDSIEYFDTPKNRHYGGPYRNFLEQKVTTALTPDDLPKILQWLTTKGGCFNTLSAFNKLACDSICLTIQHLDEPAVKLAFIELWQHWANDHGAPVLKSLHEIEYHPWSDDHTRLGFARDFFNHPSVSVEHYWSLLDGNLSFINHADLEWALNQITLAPLNRQEEWAKLIGHLYNFESGSKAMGLLLKRIAEHPTLADEFKWLRAWDLNEAGARSSKARHLWHLRWQRKVEKGRDETKPNFEKWSKEAKSAITDGKYWAWNHYSAYFFRTAEGGYSYGNEHDITATYGWEVAKHEERRFARWAARMYLLNCSDGFDEIQAKTNYFKPSYYAAWLLRDKILADFEIRVAVSQKWIHALTNFEMNGDEHQQEMCKLCMHLSPTKTLNSLRHNLPNTGYAFIWRSYKTCWDNSITTILCEFVLSHRTNWDIVKSSLISLHENDQSGFAQFMIKVLPLSDKFTDESKAWFNAIAHALEPKQTWKYVWATIKDNDDLASSILLNAAVHWDYEMKDHQVNLDSDELHKLTKRLYQLFPPDRKVELKAGFVTPRQSLATYRNKVLDALTAKSDHEAEAALVSLAESFPKLSSEFMWRRLSNVRSRRKAQWLPPAPTELFKMIVDSASCYITSESDLFNTILESLERFQNKLTKSELPTVGGLWNYNKERNKKVKHQPKDEEHLSDTIAIWLIDDLKDRGVIIGREVQIERSMRTDVLVKTYKKSDSAKLDEITVVIEVKGCWNPEVQTGTEEQLVKKYLIEHSWTHGIYLVGWFCCPEWDWHKPNNKMKSKSLEDAEIEVEQYAQESMTQHPELKIAGIVTDCRYK